MEGRNHDKLIESIIRESYKEIINKKDLMKIDLENLLSNLNEISVKTLREMISRKVMTSEVNEEEMNFLASELIPLVGFMAKTLSFSHAKNVINSIAVTTMNEICRMSELSNGEEKVLDNFRDELIGMINGIYELVKNRKLNENGTNTTSMGEFRMFKNDLKIDLETGKMIRKGKDL